MGNVRLYGATSGYTELAPPAVAPDGVLSLPSGVGTLLTAEGGKVLQVVRATDSTERTTTSTSFVDGSLSVTITPQKSTSAVLLICNVLTQKDNDNDYIRVQITNSSNVAVNGAESSMIGTFGATNHYGTQTLIGYSSPGTISATTFKMRFRSNSGGLSSIRNSVMTGQLYAIEVSS